VSTPLHFLLRILILLALVFFAMVCLYAFSQRKLLYYPTHRHDSNGLSQWRKEGRLIGYSRAVPAPESVWLLLHGNAGQATDRAYALPSFSGRDSVFILEYPGYGPRPGSPSMTAINAAAREGYRELRARFPRTPVCVAGESVGSGPASILALEDQPPDKIVLITPFDVLSRVASYHFKYLPAGLILRDNWSNVEALKGYRGRLEIFAARDDEVIPMKFAKALAESKPASRFHVIDGGHNDWSLGGRVVIRNR
jgi:uncharacterized protein